MKTSFKQIRLKRKENLWLDKKRNIWNKKPKKKDKTKNIREILKTVCIMATGSAHILIEPNILDSGKMGKGLAKGHIYSKMENIKGNGQTT